MQVALKNMQGAEIGSVELSDDIFSAEINTAIMHQALVRQLANRRLGTHSTKTRSDVRGGGRKPWRQKGTGRARQGTIRAPQWRGGGAVFGPTPRSYEKKMPRKMRHIALRSALTTKAQDQQVVILDDLQISEPRTKTMVSMLDALEVGRRTLVVLPAANSNIELSARNLPNVTTLRANYLNVRDLLGHTTIVLPQEALAIIESYLGNEQERVEESSNASV